MKVALLQLASPDNEPIAERVERTGATIAQLDSVDLVVLPELWAPGYFAFDRYESLAEPLDGQLMRTLATWAREHAVHLQVGSVLERAGAGEVYNTAVLLGPDGALLHTYRKTHVFGYQSLEAQLLEPGRELGTVQTAFGSVGMSTCYDLRFPELYRCLLDGGMTALIVPAAWPAARLEHWQLFTRVRAVENQIVVIACGAAGTQRGVTLSGHSVVVDPWGRVIAEAGPDEQVLYADVDLDLVAATRAEFPVLADRMIRAQYTLGPTP